MSKMYYRVKKDTFLWDKGAILEKQKFTQGMGYVAINDLWDATEHMGNEYISARIIENDPDWFERVYPVNLVSKTVYKIKEEAREFFEKTHKE